ncbi:hypothetical protein GCM10010435_44090 [Winogradskya consettensis]|uniref:Uncharacterized protein n=2 Tax=Winogradskya consettensis TaxID=113560 RepID=A0A919T2M2_9ACTN|nr:hypothetical protein Aco04nite_82480 [Actinoplanes consettensis]
MLAAGGCSPVAGSTERSYELRDEIAMVTAEPAGHAVKLLDHFYRIGFPAAPEWRFVWLDRDAAQQARSHAKLAAAAFGFEMDAGLQALYAASYATDRPGRLAKLRAAGPVLVLDFERVLAQPRKTAKLLRREVWPDLDVDAAVAAVHQRSPECLPDMSFELGS